MEQGDAPGRHRADVEGRTEVSGIRHSSRLRTLESHGESHETVIGDISGDIDAFRQATVERLAREPIDAKVEPAHEAVPYSSYLVTLRSLDGVRIRARLAIPVQGEAPAPRWPLIVTAPGYGGEQQGVMLGDCQRGYAILQVFPRGQGDSAPLSKLDGDKLTGKLDRPEGAYYQGAYADIIRVIDFAVSRKRLHFPQLYSLG